MIYFDNSATTHTKPKQVLTQTLQGLTKYSANGTRSSHKLSLQTGLQISIVREKMQKFVNASTIENIIFTSGCTEALNLAILGSVKQDGHVIYTINEHNSVLRPLSYLEQKGEISLSKAIPQNEEALTWEDIALHLKPNTYLVCVNHISNVDGMRADIKTIGNELKKRNILFLVDGAQSIGHEKIDMQAQNISFLAISPHKGLYSPQGVGVLVLGEGVMPKPIKFGGTGTESYNLTQPTSLPEAFETGTLPLPNILGLGAGIDFVNENFDEISEKVEDLVTYLNFELRKINNVILYTHPNNCSGVVSFNIKGKTSEEVCLDLDEKFKICARSGLHCAPLKHEHLGTLQTGTVRISLSYFNNFSEIATLIRAIKQLSK
jgi:cysteine desulfurase family protein